MKTLVIVDVKDKASLEKLKSLEGEIALLSDFQVRESLYYVPTEIEGKQYTTALYGTFKLSSFERKVFIKSENQEFNLAVEGLLKHFKNHVGDYRPFAWRKEVNTGDTLDNVNLIIKTAKKTDVARYILRYNIVDPNMRFLNAKKLKFYINRAFFRAGFPARKKKVNLTDKFKFKEYSYGVDYCIGQLTQRPTESCESLIAKFNESLEPFGIKAERLEIYSMDTKAADFQGFFMSEIQTDFEYSKVSAAIEGFLNSASCPVKIKTQGMMRDSYVTIEIDARPHVKDLWAQQINGATVIRCISEAPVSLYQLLPTILKTAQKNVIRFPVKRIEFFKPIEESEIDIFDEVCEECGNTIEKNPFDEPISDTFCARHLPFDSEITAFASAVSEEDEQADAEAAAIEATPGEALSTENDITDVEGEGDEFNHIDEENED